MSLTRDAIWQRYREAATTLLRLPQARQQTLTSWPSIVRDYGDALASEEQRAFEAYPFPKGWERERPPHPHEIDQMEELWTWHSRFLAPHETLARLTITLAWQQTIGRGAAYVARQFRISRRCVYNYRDRSCEIIRRRLNQAAKARAPDMILAYSAAFNSRASE